jgi:predicted adenylyl cyclase CyaB
VAFEIELKAWVDEHEAVKRALDAVAEFIARYTKEDRYYVLADGARRGTPRSGVRVRSEFLSGAADGGGETRRGTVTWKSKELRSDIEVNSEHEFCIKEAPGGEDARAVFDAFLRMLGFTESYTKTKRGFAYRAGEITAELSFVEGLGWFLELEILRQTDDAAGVAAARKKLHDFLAAAGVREERIETRYYSELLGSLLSGA